MSLAFAGPHACGKSTLAQAFAKRTGMTFVTSRASAVFKSLGLNGGGQLSFEQRMLAQEAILELHVHDVREAGSSFVSDRSTLDMAAYTLIEWGSRATPEQQQELLAYTNLCYDLANQLYSTIILVQPGIPYVAKENRPPPSEPYQELMTTVLRGMLHDPKMTCISFFLKRGTLNLEERVNCTVEAWSCMVEQTMQGLQEETVH